MRLWAQLAVVFGAFAAAAAVAELAGAANLGTAFAFGQMAFVIVLVATMVRA